MSTAVLAGAPPVDRKAAWKIVATVLAALGGLGGVFYASAGDDVQLYRMVDEVVADPTKYQGKRLDVHGFVVKDSIEQKTGSLFYRFKIESKAPRAHHVMDVTFQGLVPDTFKSEAEAVVTGVLTADNKLIGEKISAKCPSKYDAKDGVPKGGAANYGTLDRK